MLDPAAAWNIHPPSTTPTSSTSATPAKRGALSAGNGRPRGRPKKIRKTEGEVDPIIAGSKAPERMKAILAASNQPDPSRYDLSTFSRDNDLPAPINAVASTDSTNAIELTARALFPNNPHGMLSAGVTSYKSVYGSAQQPTNSLSRMTSNSDDMQDDSDQFHNESGLGGTQIKQENGFWAGGSNDASLFGMDLDSLKFPEDNVDVDMFGNFVDHPPHWTPTYPQPPIHLADGTVFDANDYASAINSAIHELMGREGNPIFLRSDAVVANLEPQQIHERNKIVAKTWQVHCAGILAKLRVTSYFVVVRRLLLTTATDERSEVFTHWDGTWHQSPRSRGGWAFVDRNGAVYDTSNKQMIDMQAIFEQHLGLFGGDHEEMIHAGLNGSQGTVGNGSTLINPALLSRNNSSGGSTGGY